MDDRRPLPASRIAELRQALLDLAYDVHSYLRRHARAAVRVSAAVLIATSLAACGPSVVPGGGYTTVSPLSQEIRSGLPGQPGRYPIVPGSVGRDAQGVYYFAWRGLTDPANVKNYASASLLRLAQGSTSELDVPSTGDPTLYLPSDASIPLINSANEYRTSSYNSGYYPLWHPFYGGYHGTGYYDLPTQTVSSGDVNGSRISTAPSAPSSRVVGLARAVSGRAGGSGSGVAATNKSGAPVSSASSVDHGGAASAKSGGFSSGSASSSSGSSSS